MRGAHTESPTMLMHGQHWPLQVCQETYGVRVTVCATSMIREEEIRRALPPGRSAKADENAGLVYFIVSTEGADGEHRLYRGTECVCRTDDPRGLLWDLQNDADWRVAALAREVVFVHAGAVSYNGRGIVLPGVSGAGKSTLVRRLLERGATYYSDEYAVLDRAGRLLPFPCLLKLKDRSPDAWRVEAAEFGAPTGLGPVQVALVAFPCYTPGGAIRWEPLTPGTAALQSLQYMPACRARPAAALDAAIALTIGAVSASINHGDSAQAAERLLQGLSLAPR